VRLFLLAFVVYNANLRSISSLDTYPNRFLPISIIREFNLDLDEFPFLHKYPEWMQADPQKAAYYVRKARGHYMSNYPVMPAVLSVPVYVIPVLLGMTDGPPSTTGFSRTEIVATLLSKVSASAAVAFSGMIGFIGLIVPHALRLVWGGDYRRLLPLSILGGAAVLLLADLLARSVFAPQVLPVGILTALAGVPFFLWLLRRARAQMIW